MVGDRYISKMFATHLKTSDGLIIRFTSSALKCAGNERGVIKSKFDLTPKLGIYKTLGSNRRWFLISTNAEYTRFDAEEIDIEQVHILLVKFGQWLEPDWHNVTQKRKYRDVFYWLRDRRVKNNVKS